MGAELKLLCVLAHPDDETLGTGGILARYAAEGVSTHLVTATRGERGWFGEESANPGLVALGRLREAELRAAAAVLRLGEVNFLDYVDGDLDQADHRQAVSQIAAHLRRIRPQVVVTFDPFGGYGHPDHIAISQFTTAAIVAAADPAYGEGPAHRVSKLYYLADREELVRELEALGGEWVMLIDGVERRPAPWKEWAITTRVDAGDYWQQLREAALCHKTQLPGFEVLLDQPEAVQRRLWSPQTLYRAFSLVNGGRRVENDLFEGLR